MTSQMIQDWVIRNKHQAGAEINEEPKVFFDGRSNSVKIKALWLSFPANVFLLPSWVRLKACQIN